MLGSEGFVLPRKYIDQRSYILLGFKAGDRRWGLVQIHSVGESSQEDEREWEEC